MRAAKTGRCLLRATEIILAFLRTGFQSSGAIDEYCLSGGDRRDVKPFSVSQDSGCYKIPWVDEIRDPDRGKSNDGMPHIQQA